MNSYSYRIQKVENFDWCLIEKSFNTVSHDTSFAIIYKSKLKSNVNKVLKSMPPETIVSDTNFIIPHNYFKK